MSHSIRLYLLELNPIPPPAGADPASPALDKKAEVILQASFAHLAEFDGQAHEKLLRLIPTRRRTLALVLAVDIAGVQARFARMGWTAGLPLDLSALLEEE